VSSGDSPLRRSYDRVARRYAEHFADELARKPFDRSFLDRVAAGTSARGWTVDLGCGPSQIGSYLASRGLRVLGVDLSEAMLREARALRAQAVCLQADMRALPLGAASVAAVVAFYSLIHISRSQIPATLAEVGRVLAPEGRFALAVHVGNQTVHRDEMLDEPVDMDFFFYDPEQLARDLAAAGFTVHSLEVRDHYPGGVEAETRRAYIVAGR
jgi:SAM-dependent methyltransferase